MGFKIHQPIFQVYVIFVCKALPINTYFFSVFTVYSTHISSVFTLVIWLPFITIQTGHQAENALNSVGFGLLIQTSERAEFKHQKPH